jgi:hypothetical protein
LAISNDINRVTGKIKTIYERRRAYLYALSLAYAGHAIRRFRAQQPAVSGERGKYWTNRTAQAAARMFTRAFMDGDSVGWRMSHGVKYGVYLELANNRRGEAIRPIVEAFGLAMIAAAKKYYRGDM